MGAKPHSDETKAAVIAALLAGQGVNEVARTYKLPKATVSRIKSTIAAEVMEQVGTQKRERIGDLVEGLLRASLTAATGIAEKVNNAEWIAKQEAHQVGVLFGVLADKSVRILEAAEAAFSNDDDMDSTTGAADAGAGEPG